MPTKIRLQRKGKKGQPFYHLVVADGRAPRDGKFIERIGSYNPMTHPATIVIDFDRALHWVQVGAQPTDTARSILSVKGVMLKHHLLKGVTKGALTEDQVEEKFQAWITEKEEKREQIRKETELTKKEKAKKRKEEEKKISDDRAEELAKKLAKENLKAEEATKEEGAEEKEEGSEETVSEEAAEVKEAVSEAPEKAEETPEKKETESKEEKEAPKAEEKKEDEAKKDENK